MTKVVPVLEQIKTFAPGKNDLASTGRVSARGLHSSLSASARGSARRWNNESDTNANAGNQTSDKGRVAKAHDIWALGVVIVIGGQYFSWNPGLNAGLGSYSIGTLLIAIGYIVLITSVAEMCSILPFAGGAFGYSRVTHGTYVGYLVGTSESVEYIFYVASTCVTLGQMITELTQLPSHWEPLYWIIFFVSSVSLMIAGGNLFWKFNMGLAIVITALLVSYSFVSIPDMNLSRHAMRWEAGAAAGEADGGGGTIWFIGGFKTFMMQFPLASWFFIGCEACPMACQDTIEPKVNVPRGMVACVATLAVTCTITFISTVAVGPDLSSVASQLLPLNYGFAHGFHVPDNQVRLMSIITLPAVWATGFGFIFSYGRQLQAMSGSGLLPSILARTYKDRGTPYMALIIGSILSFLATFAAWNRPVVIALLFQICIIAAFITYLCQLVSFIKLRHVFSSLDRAYQSPLGTRGAYLGIAIFSLALVAVVFYQESLIAIAVIISYLVCASIYYFLWARHRQVFSAEETKAMFNAYIIKANLKKTRRQGAATPRGINTAGGSSGENFKTTSIAELRLTIRQAIAGSNYMEQLRWAPQGNSRTARFCRSLLNAFSDGIVPEKNAAVVVPIANEADIPTESILMRTLPLSSVLKDPTIVEEQEEEQQQPTESALFHTLPLPSDFPQLPSITISSTTGSSNTSASSAAATTITSSRTPSPTLQGLEKRTTKFEGEGAVTSSNAATDQSKAGSSAADGVATEGDDNEKRRIDRIPIGGDVVAA